MPRNAHRARVRRHAPGTFQSRPSPEAQTMPHSPRRASLVLSMLLVLGACEAPAPRTTATQPAPALFETFGALHRDTGSKVPAAQRYFDQGLRMAYGFNHEAAARSFAEAARLDPDCAMCLWGQALVLGPNINLAMQPEANTPAFEFSRAASALAGHATPADRAMIEALQARYADPAPEDRRPLDKAYADAMARVVAEFPQDDDAATLYAEALMDLTPWSYWTRDGAPTGQTSEITATLERVLARNPAHIGAVH